LKKGEIEMKTFKSVWLVLAILMLSMLAACGNEKKQDSASQSAQVEPAKAEATEVTIENNGTT
jgi:iron complex transport system substrate-binding protein